MAEQWVLTFVHQRRDHFCLWPFRLCVELFRQPVPSTLVRNGDFGEVVVQNGLMKVNDELEFGQKAVNLVHLL